MLHLFVNQDSTIYNHGYYSSGNIHKWVPIRMDMDPDNYKEETIVSTEVVAGPELPP